LKRCSSVINKKSLEWLVKSWALDCFNDRKILLNNIDVMLDWIKNVWVADFWLFWWIGLDTSIPLKKVELANHMEKLMMEHEVLKVFVSW
jgi:DNA polymerase III alpha subunit